MCKTQFLPLVCRSPFFSAFQLCAIRTKTIKMQRTQEEWFEISDRANKMNHQGRHLIRTFPRSMDPAHYRSTFQEYDQFILQNYDHEGPNGGEIFRVCTHSDWYSIAVICANLVAFQVLRELYDPVDAMFLHVKDEREKQIHSAVRSGSVPMLQLIMGLFPFNLDLMELQNAGSPEMAQYVLDNGVKLKPTKYDDDGDTISSTESPLDEQEWLSNFDPIQNRLRHATLRLAEYRPDMDEHDFLEPNYCFNQFPTPALIQLFLRHPQVSLTSTHVLELQRLFIALSATQLNPYPLAEVTIYYRRATQLFCFLRNRTPRVQLGPTLTIYETRLNGYSHENQMRLYFTTVALTAHGIPTILQVLKYLTRNNENQLARLQSLLKKRGKPLLY